MADAQTSANGAGGCNSSSANSATDTCRTVLVIDGAYAHIGARSLEGNRIDYIKFRSVLETLAGSRLRGADIAAVVSSRSVCAVHRIEAGAAARTTGDGDFYDSLNQIKNVLRKDLWVIGYRDTVSADLQQLASHVIWINELWSEIKMPSGGTPVAAVGSGNSAAIAGCNGNDGGNGKPARHEMGEEDGELSDCEALHPQKRGKERQVQVTSQKPQAASRDKQQRRDRSQSRQRPDPPQPPAAKNPVNITLPVAAMTLASAPLRNSHYGPGDARSSRAERKVLRVKRKRNGAPPGLVAASKARDKDALSRRIPVAPVTFTMSDISSSDDDDNRIPNASPLGGKRKEPQVIDLASDSDTSSD